MFKIIGENNKVLGEAEELNNAVTKCVEIMKNVCPILIIRDEDGKNIAVVQVDNLVCHDLTKGLGFTEKILEEKG